MSLGKIMDAFLGLPLLHGFHLLGPRTHNDLTMPATPTTKQRPSIITTIQQPSNKHDLSNNTNHDNKEKCQVADRPYLGTGLAISVRPGHCLGFLVFCPPLLWRHPWRGRNGGDERLPSLGRRCVVSLLRCG